MVDNMTPSSVGPLVREWRERRHMSQLAVSSDVGVSTKHLSYVENGKSRPSPELLISICEHLDIPMRDRNSMLVSAGHLPRYSETPLGDPLMSPVGSALERLLTTQEPYPALILDRHWNIVAGNGPAQLLGAYIPAELSGNVFRASLHPDGLAAHTTNFEEWAFHLLSQLQRLVSITADPELIALQAEVLAYPNVAAVEWRRFAAELQPGLMAPYCLELEGQQLSLFTMLTTIGLPQDVVLAELVVELLFPTDDATERFLHDRNPVASSSASDTAHSTERPERTTGDRNRDRSPARMTAGRAV